MHKAVMGDPARRRLVSVPGAAGERCFTAFMLRENPATAVAACAGCAASWRGIMWAHCRGCHETFDDEVVFDAHRSTRICVPPQSLDLVVIDGVWRRPLAGKQTAAC